MMSRFFVVFLFVGMVVALHGCHRGPAKPADLPALQDCRLTFTLDGQPLDHASVSLKPLEPSKWHAGGSTGADGSVEIHTNGLYRGAPAGKYKVTVSKTVAAPPPENVPEADLMDPVKSAKYRRPPIQHVHSKYGDETSTPLEIEILAGAPAQAAFSVEKP